ncbi:MAG: general secretion pathway protein GspB [Verrucomicrobiota bacterium]|nr:general secretion pathway protein GspB [Verrucomicrobiota bacterium]
MKRFGFFIILVVAALPQSQAGDATALVVKNKSSFEIDARTRNPFWPIGWKPAAKLADVGVEHGGPDVPLTAFVVSSITMEQGTRFAIINGKVMQEGQQFGLQLGNQTYQITVKSIEDGKVTLARRDQEIVIPLRRK